MNKTILFIILALVVIGGMASILLYLKSTQPNEIACTLEAKLCPDGSAVGRTGPNCEFAECPSAQSVETFLYQNKEFGFELILSDYWRDYKVVPTENGSYIFCLPTIYKNYPDSLCGSDNINSGYASVFYISAFSHSDWSKQQMTDGPKNIFLAENKDFVFGFGLSQDSPPDLLTSHNEAQKVLSTFKFTQ